MSIAFVTDTFRLYADNDIEEWRVLTFKHKEPETLAWLEKIPDGVTLWDIGANIGIYAIWAALTHPKSTVYAFEPELHNYVRLCENIRLNGCDNCIPVHLALTDYTRFCRFYVPRAVVGASGGQVDRPRDEKGDEFVADEVQHVLGVSGAFINRFLLSPNHIKIDLDGHENEAVEGLGGLLHAVQSVLVEINGGGSYITETMKRHGLAIDTRYDAIPGHSTERRQREGIPARNVVYSRR